MGIERICVSAKIKPRNRQYMDEIKQAMLPFEVSDSAVIDGVLTYADTIRLSAQELHRLLRKDSQLSLPVMIGTKRIDPLQEALEAANSRKRRRA